METQISSSEISFPATINKVVFFSPDSGYTVFSAKPNRESQHFLAESYPNSWSKIASACVKCVSCQDPSSLVGKPVIFMGSIEKHPKYGEQFGAKFYFVDQPSDQEGMRDYLATLPNVGPYRAKEIIKSFGFKPEVLSEIIEKDPAQIVNLKIGLTLDRTEAMRNKWIEDEAMRNICLWLSRHGIVATLARKIIHKWGSNSVSVIQKDPYVLTLVRGIGFKTADAVAFKILEKVDPERRSEACLIHVLQESLASDGHLCLPVSKMKAEAFSLLIPSDRSSDYEACINKVLATSKSIVVDTISGQPMAYLFEIREKEASIAQMLKSRYSGKSVFSLSDKDQLSAEEKISAFIGRTVYLDDNQRGGVRSAFEHKISVITGGGGTGKSTICHCICSAAKEMGLTIRLLTPTGKAAKVLSKKTGVEAMTIHRSLGMTPDVELPKNTITEDIIIIDEFSMCGLDTVYAVLYAMLNNPNANLVLVGDHQQLPSVSPGNFLADIIASGIANVVRLKRIYRQSENSFITVVADNISKGISADIPHGASDIIRNNIGESCNVASDICNIIVRSHKEKGISLGDMHVLVSMYKGPRGVWAINEAIQKAVSSISGSAGPFRFGDSSYYVGDRVMQVENDYEKLVFNGDVGTVVEVGKKVLDIKISDQPEPYMIVDYEGNHLLYKSADSDQIMLAWATTVHKYQGSQCPYIIFVAPNEHSFMLSRELVYTAITRAQEKVILFGNQKDLTKVPKRTVAASRHTGLISRINAIC